VTPLIAGLHRRTALPIISCPVLQFFSSVMGVALYWIWIWIIVANLQQDITAGVSCFIDTDRYFVEYTSTIGAYGIKHNNYRLN